MRLSCERNKMIYKLYSFRPGNIYENLHTFVRGSLALTNKSSRFSSNSEAYAQELLESRRNVYYYMHSSVISMFLYASTYLCVTRRQRAHAHKILLRSETYVFEYHFLVYEINLLFYLLHDKPCYYCGDLL